MASEPVYGVTADLDVMIPAPDGVGLATDVYRPTDPETGEVVETPLPVLLDRTPYGKEGARGRHGEWYASRGYVVAVQDVRGRFDSEGDFDIFVDEAADGAAAVEWLARQPYCDGQVGTLGTSYGAWTQSALATQDPDGLAAMFVNMGAANGRKAAFRHNGAFELRWLCWAFTLAGGFAHACLGDPDRQQRFADVDVREVFADWPPRRGETALAELPGYEDWAFEIMETGAASHDRWRSPGIDFERYYDESADVPTVYSGGWFDSYAKSTCDNYVGLADRKESDHHLIVGPWTHLARLPGGHDHSDALLYPPLTWELPVAGDLDLGPDATRPYRETRLRFFDHHLKGLDTWADEPPVRYFLMGTGDGHRTDEGHLFHGGEWRTAGTWPPGDTEPIRFYVHGDGTLSTDRPAEDGGATSYEYDPADPVPTVGGNSSAYLTYEPREESVRAYPLGDRKLIDFAGRGAHDQREHDWVWGDGEGSPLADRDDVLVFRTPPLEEAVTIAGPVHVRVYGETDAADTDFTAKLIDEYPPSGDYPDGYALNLCDSICRGRFRGYREAPDFVEPGTVAAFDMEPYPTANVFEAGHRIRLDVSSSNFPRYDPNPNTGGPLFGDEDTVVATNAVHHSREHATYVELPFQPG